MSKRKLRNAVFAAVTMNLALGFLPVIWLLNLAAVLVDYDTGEPVPVTFSCGGTAPDPEEQEAMPEDPTQPNDDRPPKEDDGGR